MNWIQSALMGFVSGLAEPMPLSAEAHRGLMSRLMGTGTVPPLFLLSCHLAVLIVVLLGAIWTSSGFAKPQST